MKSDKDTYTQFRMSSEYKALLQQAAADFDTPVSALMYEGLNHRILERYASMAASLYRLAKEQQSAGNYEKAKMTKAVFTELIEKAHKFALDQETQERFSEWLQVMETKNVEELQEA